MNKILLISSSFCHDYDGYLGSAWDAISAIMENVSKEILFIPYARPSGRAYQEYFDLVNPFFTERGFMLSNICEMPDPITAIENTQAIFVGGGNTFALLAKLYEINLLSVIKERMKQGMIYIGVSAGANIAGINIKTTNDMPAVWPPSLDALGLVPFNINPHYINKAEGERHKGESRDTRIIEVMKLNPGINKVVALYEGVQLMFVVAWYKVFGKFKIFSRTGDRINISEGEDNIVL